MCKAPKPPAPKEPKKPQFLRNRYLDEFVGEAQAVNSMRTGRSSLRIPLSAAAPDVGSSPSSPPLDVPRIQPVRPIGTNADRLTGRPGSPQVQIR
jgi:hypothetical protein